MTRKILHLSDLHCDASVKWDENFNALKRLVAEICPDIIVITGDLVDAPKEIYFNHIADKIRQLGELISGLSRKMDKRNSYIISVPGNHDYYYYGLRFADNIPLLRRFIGGRSGFFGRLREAFKKRSELYQKYSRVLIYPNDEIESAVMRIYDEYNIRIYPIDSNSKRSLDNIFAEGYVKDPEAQFARYGNKFDHKNYDFIRNKENKISISLLHHHPLPLPTDNDRGTLEPFLTLINSYSYLYSAMLNDIDLVLNGHEHVSGVSEFKIKDWRHDDIGKINRKPINVISCGSSAKVSEPSKYARLIEIKKSGAVISKSYLLKGKKSSEDTGLIEVIPYGEQRKRLCHGPKKKKEKVENIRKINSKSKQVDLDYDGTATVFINYSGIRWQDNIRYDNLIIKEKLRSDIGRVGGGGCGLYPENDTDYYLPFWDEPREYSELSLVEIEEKNIEIKPLSRGLVNTERLAHGKIQYMYFNGFVLAEEMYEEIFGEGLKPSREFCTIESLYPTELLELQIRFPSDAFMPEKDKVHLVPINKAADDKELFDDIRANKYEVNYEEYRYLEKKMSLRYYNDTNEISVIIKHPQQDLLYLLIWELPKVYLDSMLSLDQKKKLKNLLLKFKTGENDSVDNFYLSVSEKLKKDGVEVVIIGLDNDRHVMRVVKGPDNMKGKEFRTGRGLAGKALRSRTWQYYEKGEKNQQIEILYEGYDPIAALSIPLDYSLVYAEEIEEKKYKEGCHYPVFAVVSLVAFNDDTTIKEFGLSMEKGGIELMQRINENILESFRECFS